MNNKILIIDRETDVLQILETLLTTKGYQVKTATSGEEAIDFIKSEIFHLVNQNAGCGWPGVHQAA